jgi:hypothetical protein
LNFFWPPGIQSVGPAQNEGGIPRDFARNLLTINALQRFTLLAGEL